VNVLDLCSGTGSATRAFEERGHNVVRLDLCTDLGRPDILADIRFLPIRTGLRWDLVWCSPPCTEFSRMSMPWQADFKGKPSLHLVETCKRIIEEMAPTFWILENVRGSQPHIEPLLGPSRHWGPWYYWGVLPMLMDPGNPRKRAEHWGSKDRKRRNAVHPSISLSLSLSLCLALERELA
jgi:hypothetical protein